AIFVVAMVAGVTAEVLWVSVGVLPQLVARGMGITGWGVWAFGALLATAVAAPLASISATVVYADLLVREQWNPAQTSESRPVGSRPGVPLSATPRPGWHSVAFWIVVTVVVLVAIGALS